MTSKQGLQRIRRVLISVSDKSGIVEFARALRNFNIDIISTGGTANHLRQNSIEIKDVSEVTGFPEMMDGRVKTLHPKVHGGLLARRDKPEHVGAMSEHGIEPIDMVVVNLYPFEETVSNGSTFVDAIEQIDIGGPAMIRSAAKNFEHVAVVVNPTRYESVLNEMNEFGGSLSLDTRRELALEAFNRTSTYDNAIANYFANQEQQTLAGENILRLRKSTDLRYGENPHQQAALYEIVQRETSFGIAQAQVLSGKEMSYNNYVDTDAAWQLVSDFDEKTCAIIKHTNPAGVAQGNTAEEAYRKALATDPVSAFGGIVAFNSSVDVAAAKAVIEIFTEVVVAPDYEPEALEILRTKKNLRVLRAGQPEPAKGLEYRQITGGMLVQTRDTHKLNREELRTVTKRQPTGDELAALLFAWTVAKHTKSNAIVYAREGQTIGVGAGQMSRVDSVKLGAMRARLPLQGSVLASDAFFPFRDGVDEASRTGITAIIQPGGSVKDEEVIQAADEHGLAMVFTGIRHFKH